MADSVLYELANESEFSPELFVSKQWAYINDNNNQSYSSAQIQIDTSSIKMMLVFSQKESK